MAQRFQRSDNLVLADQGFTLRAHASYLVALDVVLVVRPVTTPIASPPSAPATIPMMASMITLSKRECLCFMKSPKLELYNIAGPPKRLQPCRQTKRVVRELTY